MSCCSWTPIATSSKFADWNPELSNTPLYLVVSDLDGSLLDHHTYRYDAARPALDLLEQRRIPLVLASSKTRAEMLALRSEMGNQHPFIVENGAAVLIPTGYFQRPPAEAIERDGFWVRELAPPRAHWLPILDELRGTMPGAFQDFASAGVEALVEMTGLSAPAAALARQREYTEPVQWRGSDAERAAFFERLRAAGATVWRGGRFYSVGGDSDKGAALKWLRRQYALAAGAAAVYDLAVGDGPNDVPMLEAAHHALLIPTPERELPQLARETNLIVGRGRGPRAWAWGVGEWLRGLGPAPEEL